MSEIRCPLNSQAEKNGRYPAIISASATVSFEQLDELVQATASNLQGKGLQKDDRVALLGENSLDYCILLLSLYRIGAVACPVSYRLPEEALKQSLQEIECKLLLRVGSTAVTPGLPGIEELSGDKLIAAKGNNSHSSDQAVVNLNHPAAIMFTSGSAATPKAALLSYGNHYYNALGANELIPFRTGDRWLLSLPLFHVGGLGILFRAVLGGGAVVIPSRDDDLCKVVLESEITHLSCVPTQLYRIVNSGQEFAGKTLKVLVGGGPVNHGLLKKAQSAGLNVYTTYGMTEMASQVSTGIYDGSYHSGYTLNYRELKIDDNGEILVKGETLFLGYVDKEAVDLPLDADRWYHTGDIGGFDDRGRLVVSGRKDNMIISGGENVHPEEIEMQLTQIDGIKKALVVGIPDEEFGERPVAFIDFKEAKISEDVINSCLEQVLPGFKLPVFYFDWPDELFMAGLKPSRTKLRILASEAILSRN